MLFDLGSYRVNDNVSQVNNLGCLVIIEESLGTIATLHQTIRCACVLFLKSSKKIINKNLQFIIQHPKFNIHNSLQRS